LKKVEGDHHNSIAALEKHLFSAEKKRVEKETMLRYECLLMMARLYACRQQFITLWKYATFSSVFDSFGGEYKAGCHLGCSTV
jgi:hypothetical protein